MENSYFKELAKEIIDPKRWSDFLKRFIDVLRINIFLVDSEGRTIIPPYREGGRERYGGKFLSTSFQFDFAGQESNFLEKFENNGLYLEASDLFDFRIFAVPIVVEGSEVIAYMMVGPVILNKKRENYEYVNLAEPIGINRGDLTDAIHEIRVISFVTIKAILDLLSEVARDIVGLNLEKKKLHQKKFKKDVLEEEFATVAQDLYAEIQLDELLVTVLDIALKLSEAECGSIMMLDETEKVLTIKVSRGLDGNAAKGVNVKLGEGISGLAVRENKSFVISGDDGDQRIKPLLRRPEIKQSAIIPLALRDRVFGVLNLHTKKEHGRIVESMDNLRHLSRLISTAIKVI